VLPYVYRVTKYDPAGRDEHGRYVGTEPAISDQGPIEAASVAVGRQVFRPRTAAVTLLR
jgi:hypothetical protein